MAHERREIAPDGVVVHEQQLRHFDRGHPGVKVQDSLDPVGMARGLLAAVTGDEPRPLDVRQKVALRYHDFINCYASSFFN